MSVGASMEQGAAAPVLFHKMKAASVPAVGELVVVGEPSGTVLLADPLSGKLVDRGGPA